MKEDKPKKPRPMTAADIRKLLDGMPHEPRQALIYAWMEFLGVRKTRKTKR